MKYTRNTCYSSFLIFIFGCTSNLLVVGICSVLYPTFVIFLSILLSVVPLCQLYVTKMCNNYHAFMLYTPIPLLSKPLGATLKEERLSSQHHYSVEGRGNNYAIPTLTKASFSLISLFYGPFNHFYRNISYSYFLFSGHFFPTFLLFFFLFFSPFFLIFLLFIVSMTSCSSGFGHATARDFREGGSCSWIPAWRITAAPPSPGRDNQLI